MLFKDVFDQPETMRMQFRRRLDRVRPPLLPNCEPHRGGSTHILLALEQIYCPSFPELNMRQWKGSIYTGLTHLLLDPQSQRCVIMDNLMRQVTTALELSNA